MKDKVRDIHVIMQNLYDESMKYPDEKLAKAINEVRNLVVEYKNVIDGYAGEPVLDREELVMESVEKWNETDGSLYFINPEKTRMYLIEEGSGDNLLDEDYEDGFVDYWLTSTFDLVNKEIVEEQAMWMETKPIFAIDYSIPGLIARLKECDAPADLEDWEIIPAEKGDEIRDALESIDEHILKSHIEMERAEYERKRFNLREILL